jgi:hypothetical protein
MRTKKLILDIVGLAEMIEIKKGPVFLPKSGRQQDGYIWYTVYNSESCKIEMRSDSAVSVVPVDSNTAIEIEVDKRSMPYLESLSDKHNLQVGEIIEKLLSGVLDKADLVDEIMEI